MDRIWFTVTPYYNGWQVRDELRTRDWFAQRVDALRSADTLAMARSSLTGQPTGVLMDDGRGDRVLYARHD